MEQNCVRGAKLREWDPIPAPSELRRCFSLSLSLRGLRIVSYRIVSYRIVSLVTPTRP